MWFSVLNLFVPNLMALQFPWVINIKVVSLGYKFENLTVVSKLSLIFQNVTALLYTWGIKIGVEYPWGTGNPWGINCKPDSVVSVLSLIFQNRTVL